MTINLTDPIFHDENAAREHFEAIRWPNGPFCPHCGSVENITRLQGKSHRPGLHQCNSCRGHFTVTNGSVMERSHIPLTKGYRLSSDGGEQERHLGAPTASGVGNHVQGRLVHVPPHPGGYAGRTSDPARRPRQDRRGGRSISRQARDARATVAWHVRNKMFPVVLVPQCANRAIMAVSRDPKPPPMAVDPSKDGGGYCRLGSRDDYLLSMPDCEPSTHSRVAQYAPYTSECKDVI